MKRRNFLKGLLGGVLAAPAIAKSVSEPDFPITDLAASDFDVRVGDVVQIGDDPALYRVGENTTESYGNAFLTPEEITREALNVLNNNLNRYKV